MKKFSAIIVITVITGMLSNHVSLGCTNFLVTRGASVTGSTMITYSADSHVLYGELYYWPGRDYPVGSMMDVFEWDTHKYLGRIKL